MYCFLYSRSSKHTTVKKIEYHNGRQDVPIYCFQKRRPTTSEAVGIILDPDLDSGRVCTSQPTYISKNCVFIVDLKELKHPSDVLCDDIGTWVCNGCRRTWICVDENGEVEFFDKNKPTKQHRFPSNGTVGAVEDSLDVPSLNVLKEEFDLLL